MYLQTICCIQVPDNESLTLINHILKRCSGCMCFRNSCRVTLSSPELQGSWRRSEYPEHRNLKTNIWCLFSSILKADISDSDQNTFYNNYSRVEIAEALLNNCAFKIQWHLKYSRESIEYIFSFSFLSEVLPKYDLSFVSATWSGFSCLKSPSK